MGSPFSRLVSIGNKPQLATKLLYSWTWEKTISSKTTNKTHPNSLLVGVDFETESHQSPFWIKTVDLALYRESIRPLAH